MSEDDESVRFMLKTNEKSKTSKHLTQSLAKYLKSKKLFEIFLNLMNCPFLENQKNIIENSFLEFFKITIESEGGLYYLESNFDCVQKIRESSFTKNKSIMEYLTIFDSAVIIKNQISKYRIQENDFINYLFHIHKSITEINGKTLSNALRYIMRDMNIFSIFYDQLIISPNDLVIDSIICEILFPSFKLR
mgnify:CR=1 FL=1